MSVVEIASSALSAPPRNDGGIDSRFRGNDSWVDNSDIQKLLDVVSEIIANEYIEIAKNNRDVFMDSRLRGNDSRGDEE
jgi:hypothetical protein